MHRVDEAVKASLLARLDRIPVMGIHYGWALLLAVNVMLEYYDNAIFAYASPTIRMYADLSTAQIGVISSAFFVGMIMGGLVGGSLADRYGRRSVLVWTTVLYSLGALATAFAPSYETILASRVITGIGCQAAMSILLVYISEMFPAKARGRFLSVATFGFVISALGTAALAMLYLPQGGANAWRHLFLVGSVGLLIAPFIRFTLPESVRWYVSMGLLDRAERTISDLEQRALRRGPLAPPRPILMRGDAKGPTLHDLLNNKVVMRTIAIIGIAYFGSTLAYYLFANWGVYALVHGLQYPLEEAYRVQFLWNAIYCITPLLTYLFLDRIERKTTIFITSLFSAIPLVILGLSTNNWIVISAGGLAAIVTGMVVNAYYTYIPETIPTLFRALGSGIVLSFGRIGGAAAGVIGAALFTSGGMQGVMIAAAVCYVIFTIPVVLFGPRTTNRSLESVSPEEQIVPPVRTDRTTT